MFVHPREHPPNIHEASRMFGGCSVDVRTSFTKSLYALVRCRSPAFADPTPTVRTLTAHRTSSCTCGSRYTSKAFLLLLPFPLPCCTPLLVAPPLRESAAPSVMVSSAVVLSASS